MNGGLDGVRRSTSYSDKGRPGSGHSPRVVHAKCERDQPGGMEFQNNISVSFFFPCKNTRITAFLNSARRSGRTGGNVSPLRDGLSYYSSFPSARLRFLLAR